LMGSNFMAMAGAYIYRPRRWAKHAWGLDGRGKGAAGLRCRQGAHYLLAIPLQWCAVVWRGGIAMGNKNIFVPSLFVLPFHNSFTNQSVLRLHPMYLQGSGVLWVAFGVISTLFQASMPRNTTHQKKKQRRTCTAEWILPECHCTAVLLFNHHSCTIYTHMRGIDLELQFGHLAPKRVTYSDNQA
jgi:hypothetical protein